MEDNLNFLESRQGQEHTNEPAPKPNQDDAMKGINLDGVSPAVKAWLKAKNQSVKFIGKEV